MLLVPLQAVPSQALSVQLAGQNCQINVYQKFFGVFFDLYNANTNVLIIGGCLCLNLNRLVRSAYLGFQGDFAFYDTQGATNPQYTGLGTRYQLIYLTVADLAAIGVPPQGS
jgi:hypothetical protein